MKKSLLVFCIYICSIGTLAFCSNSLAQSDTAYIKKLVDNASDFRNNFPDSAMVNSQKALLLAQKIEDNGLISLALQAKGKSFVQFENFGSAADCFLKALEIEENRKNKPRIADLSNDMGDIYYEIEKFHLSLDYYERAFTLFSELKDSTGMAIVLINIGNVHKNRLFCETRNSEERKADNRIAIEYYHKAETICLKKNRWQF